MPVYRLSSEIAFPDPSEAEPDGVLAVGGDLSADRVLAAYSVGIFPWPHRGWPLLWFSPDPRMVVFPDELKVSRSLRQTLRKGEYEITFDTDFEQVINTCGEIKRRDQEGTWITHEIARCYTRLHELGFAHSTEAWLDGELVGGLYGVSLGRAYFGESMFAKRPDASKVAFVKLVEQLKAWDFHFIDAQVYTDHLARFGAREIPRSEYRQRLDKALEVPIKRGKWQGSTGNNHPA